MKIGKEFALILSFVFLAFTLGTTEYVIVGLLPDVAQSLHVSVAHAGMLVSGFAIAFAVGTPAALMAASRFSKRTALLTGILLVALCNCCSAFAPTYLALFLARMATAVCCGLCVSLAISICTESVAEERKGQAIAWIMGGFSIANVLGVPIGTFVGVHFQWPAAFWLVAFLVISCGLLLSKMVPRELPGMKSSLRDPLRLMGNPRVGLAFLIPIVGIAAVFVIYTYITPLMTEVMHIPAGWTSGLLLLYGAASVLSNVIAGKVASGDYQSKLKRIFQIHAVIYALYGITVPYSGIGTLSLLAIACLSLSINAAAQLYIIRLTERFVPQAKDFASSLMPIGANIGIALGSLVGALVTDHLGLRYLPWMAVAFALAAYLITVLSCRLDRATEKKPPHLTA